MNIITIKTLCIILFLLLLNSCNNKKVASDNHKILERKKIEVWHESKVINKDINFTINDTSTINFLKKRPDVRFYSKTDSIIKNHLPVHNNFPICDRNIKLILAYNYTFYQYPELALLFLEYSCFSSDENLPSHRYYILSFYENILSSILAFNAYPFEKKNILLAEPYSEPNLKLSDTDSFKDRIIPVAFFIPSTEMIRSSVNNYKTLSNTYWILDYTGKFYQKNNPNFPKISVGKELDSSIIYKVLPCCSPRSSKSSKE